MPRHLFPRVTRASLFSPFVCARWTREQCTDVYEEEAAAGRVTYRTTFGTLRSGGPFANALDLRLKSPANTAVLPTTGATVLALWEAGPPFALDAETLTCQGPSDLGGRLAVSDVVRLVGAISNPALRGRSQRHAVVPMSLPARSLSLALCVPTQHGALPGTTGLSWLDGVLDRAGFLCDAFAAHPRRDSAARCTVAWSWRQELLGDSIAIALHALPDASCHDHAAAVVEPATAAAPPVRALLRRTTFAPHDMALSKSLATFLVAPTAINLAPYILGLRGPAQCTTFDRGAIAAGEGSVFHLVDRTTGRVCECALDEPYHAVHVRRITPPLPALSLPAPSPLPSRSQPSPFPLPLLLVPYGSMVVVRGVKPLPSADTTPPSLYSLAHWADGQRLGRCRRPADCDRLLLAAA